MKVLESTFIPREEKDREKKKKRKKKRKEKVKKGA